MTSGWFGSHDSHMSFPQIPDNLWDYGSLVSLPDIHFVLAVFLECQVHIQRPLNQRSRGSWSKHTQSKGQVAEMQKWFARFPEVLEPFVLLVHFWFDHFCLEATSLLGTLWAYGYWWSTGDLLQKERRKGRVGLRLIKRIVLVLKSTVTKFCVTAPGLKLISQCSIHRIP